MPSINIPDFTNTELWGLAIAAMLACVLGGYITHKDLQTRSSHDTNPFEHEPILWAEPGSWWKVPVYRLEKMLFIDIISPSGAFAAVMTWIFMKQYLELAKSSVWAVLCETALFLLAWTNFALPKYRPQFVGALVALLKAFATFVAGRWGGNVNTNSSVSTLTTTVSPLKQTQSQSVTTEATGMEEPPIPTLPPRKDN